jgi:hypothetical protein
MSSGVMKTIVPLAGAAAGFMLGGGPAGVMTGYNIGSGLAGGMGGDKSSGFVGPQAMQPNQVTGQMEPVGPGPGDFTHEQAAQTGTQAPGSGTDKGAILAQGMMMAGALDKQQQSNTVNAATVANLNRQHQPFVNPSPAPQMNSPFQYGR